MSTMVQSWLEGKGPHLQDIVASGEGKMSMEDAMHQLDGQLPAEVASLVRMSSNATSQPAQFTEASLTKARKILNNMVYDAVLELDDIVFECKEFEERNRGTYEQVINDLGRLGSQLAIIGQTRLSASSGIAEYDRKRKLVEQQIRDATAEFNEERFKNEQILTVRQNDLAVFDYVLTLTKCTPGQVFLQTDENETSRPAVSICSANDGMYLDFEDKALQAKVERMMTPNARAALREALGQVAGSLNLVQLGANPAPPTPAPPTPAPLIQPVVYEVSPVQEGPHPEGQWRKCVALALADTMLSEGGREAAQSAVLVISDGKYSMKYQTQEKVRELKDKNIQIFMAVVGPLDRDAKKVLRGWASKPASTNFLHVEGLAELEHNTELFVQKFVVKFCPDALSKTALEQEDGSKQYMMIHENGLPSNACGAWTFEGVVSNHDECATLARARTRMAFGFGREYARGRCYSEAIVIDKAWWNQYYINRANPPCPNGAWEFNPFYDTYAIDPDSIQATTTTTTTVASGGTR